MRQFMLVPGLTVPGIYLEKRLSLNLRSIHRSTLIVTALSLVAILNAGCPPPPYIKDDLTGSLAASATFYKSKAQGGTLVPSALLQNIHLEIAMTGAAAFNCIIRVFDTEPYFAERATARYTTERNSDLGQFTSLEATGDGNLLAELGTPSGFLLNDPNCTSWASDRIKLESITGVSGSFAIPTSEESCAAFCIAKKQVECASSSESCQLSTQDACESACLGHGKIGGNFTLTSDESGILNTQLQTTRSFHLTREFVFGEFQD